jgi:hypothetical protein
MSTEKQEINSFLPEIDALFKRKADEYLLKDIRQFSRSSNWASDLGFECLSYQVLCRLHPELRPLPSLELKKIFRASGILEVPNLEFISHAGIKVVEQSRPFNYPEKQISGFVDGKVEVELPTGRKVRVPLEHKAVSPNSFRALVKHKKDGIPLTKAKQPWMKKWPGQLQIYDFMDGSEFGVHMFYEKVCGDYLFWASAMDYEYVETLLQRAEQTNQCVLNGVIPVPVRKETCDGCDFEETFCFVGKSFGEGDEILIDKDEWNQKLLHYLEIKPFKSEIKEIEDELREDWEGKNLLFADVRVTWKSHDVTVYDVPEEISKKREEEDKQYAKQKPQFRMKIERLK